MKTVNVHEAKTHLSKLLARVQRGEQIVIAKAGKPVAILVRWVERMEERVPGRGRGQAEFVGDFDEPLPEDVLRDFEG